VVLVDHRRHRPWEVDSGDHVPANGAMGLDQLELLRRQGAGLVQDAGGNGYFADVVDPGPHLNALGSFPVPAQGIGDCPGQLRHAPLVAGGVGIRVLGDLGYQGDEKPFSSPW